MPYLVLATEVILLFLAVWLWARALSYPKGTVPKRGFLIIKNVIAIVLLSVLVIHFGLSFTIGASPLD
jgi:hypothetical protein